jgi:hypothetical protein
MKQIYLTLKNETKKVSFFLLSFFKKCGAESYDYQVMIQTNNSQFISVLLLNYFLYYM